MEFSTQYCQPPSKVAVNETDYIIKMKTFSQTIANWYFLNHRFLNGKMVCRFLPKARPGIPCKYYETKKTRNNPSPKVEISYVQAVVDSFSRGSAMTTTLECIRGLPYTLSGTSSLSSIPALKTATYGDFGGVA
jgi:hypothetical protein